MYAKHPHTFIRLIINSIKSTRYHLVSILITTCFTIFALHWQSHHFCPTDPIPELLHLDQKALQRTSRVTMGLHINSFPSFSFKHNDFTVDAILWFRFPAGGESLETLENFSIQNSLVQPSGQLLYKSPPIIKLIDNDVLVSYHIQTTFKAPLNFKNFPLSQHRLTMVIQNRSVTPQELYFVSEKNNVTLAQKTLVQDWEPINQTIRTGYVKSMLIEDNKTLEISHPAAVVTITFKNSGIRDLISLYFPMFVLFFIILFCLLIDITDISRLTYVAMATPILVLFRMVIDSQSPTVGYSTHIDFVYHLLVFLSLLILFFETYVVLALHRVKELAESVQEKTKKRLSLTNDIVFFIILLLVILCIIYSSFR